MIRYGWVCTEWSAKFTDRCKRCVLIIWALDRWSQPPGCSVGQADDYGSFVSPKNHAMPLIGEDGLCRYALVVCLALICGG